MSPAAPASPDAGPRSSTPPWVRVVLVLAALAFLTCGAGVTALFVVGARAPDTKVYSGREIPARFLDAVKARAPLEPGETILFFYSDAVVDVAAAFSFVSDRRVVVHDAERAQPTASLPFGEIESASLRSSSNWYEDGAITLLLHGGEELAFPVSGEDGRDKRFLAAIQDGQARSGHYAAPPAERQDPDSAP